MSVNNKPIILLTRPLLQNKALQKKLMELGFSTLIFPLLEIEKLPSEQISSDCDYVIFTSQNAVDGYQGEITVPVFAVGSGTQAALAKKNISAKIPPEFNSEGLLALPALQDVKNKRIAIIGGENPRPLLSETLRQRGAQLETIFCYRRVRPSYSSAELEKIRKQDELWIVVSSAESLMNLIRLFGAHSSWLFRQQLLVTSVNLRIQAQSLGFSLEPIVAANASDEAIISVCTTNFS